ncbi:energy-coupling factor ABC transporter ATP-binding protein [Bacillus sp. FJAT-45350]|uniref:energy-coupling factor ABC transporter ATP-binding protein n=1 Tax=Bacillus sp. FJAT-45350 TaxID=2011014 RepID=UPI000BB67AB6|nr:energy-coupling factor ABC transporter ATP-binding protein [Bacillus sp. FJAT-45350]
MEIKIEELEHRYMEKTPFEQLALKKINLSILSGSYTAIIGHTGSGKSTLIQHLNGLLKPSAGKISIGETVIEVGKKNKQLKLLRRKVGLVFQYPEHQLFEETVEKDICFGPINFGVPEKKAKKITRELLPIVGLTEDVLERSPFDLSGGQMRRVAIAGVLAMQPSVLILDEPTAGLDPQGRREIMEVFYKLHQEKKLTTILVTHHMMDAARYADHIIVMNNGSVLMEGDRNFIFEHPEKLQEVGLDVPETVNFLLKIEKKFNQPMPRNLFTVEEVAEYLSQMLIKKADN